MIEYLYEVFISAGPPLVFPYGGEGGAVGGERTGRRLLFLLTLLLTAEILWSAIRKKGVYNLKEALANFGIVIGTQFIRPLTTVWKIAVFGIIAPFQPYSFPRAGWVFLITFVVADLGYYWYHRLSHEVGMLWTMHHTHHSSPYYNLTTAVRLNWVANFVSPFFFLPLVAIGFPAEFVAGSLALGLFYQLFLHTEAIPKLGWFEGKFLNTPSAHRVHHGSNSQYIDKNYAGALIIWDRIFGTYEPEVEKVNYGVTTGTVGFNPFVIQLKPLYSYLRGEFKRERVIDEERKAAA